MIGISSTVGEGAVTEVEEEEDEEDDGDGDEEVVGTGGTAEDGTGMVGPEETEERGADGIVDGGVAGSKLDGREDGRGRRGCGGGGFGS